MATTVLSNSHYNLRVTYSISNGQVVFTKIEGCSTDGYASYGASSTLYLNSSAMMTGTVKFPANSSYYTIWEDSGGWGTSVFAGYFYATDCGGASNLKFWYSFDVPSYTLTLKTTTGVASFTGGGSYKSGTSATSVAKSATGYTLSKYVGTANDGTTSTWTSCSGKTSHTDTWTMERNRTITAYATANKYTVTYNAGGGTGTMSTQTATYNSGFTTLQNKFTKSGYKFNGWKDSLGNTWTLSSKGVYEAGAGAWTWTYTQNITLTAQWVESAKATINYIGNGGATSSGITSWTQTITVGSTASIDHNNYNNTDVNSPQYLVRSGYEFVGWSTNQNATDGSASWGSKTSKTGYTSAKNAEGNMIYYWKGTWSSSYDTSYTLYAIWKPLTYKLSFDANGGTNTVPSATMSQNVTYDSTVAVWRNVQGTWTQTPDAEWITREGYEFVGWGTNATKTSGTSWASLNLDDVMTKAAQDRGDTYVTSTNKEGRTVYYWKGNWIWNSGYTLYALWRPYGTFTKTFDSGVSSVVGGNDSYSYDTQVSFTATAKNGYNLDYYTVDDGIPIQLSGTEDTFSVSATDSVISIKVYSTPNTYTVEYDSGSATSGTAPDSQQKIHGTALTLATNTGNLAHSDTTGTASRNAKLTALYNANGGSGAPSSHSTDTQSISGTYPITWNADGWSTSSDGTTKSYDFGATYTVNEPKVLYPYWSKTNGTTTFTPKSFSIVLSDTVPTKSGYDFDGWYANSSLTGTKYNPGDTYTRSMISNTSVTFYAKWKVSANTYIKVNGEWKLGEVYINQNGTWKRGELSVNDNGSWKK